MMMMNRRLLSVVLFCLTSLSAVLAQTPTAADIVITGQVKQVMLCGHDDDVTIYHFLIRGNAKNVGSEPIIFSTAQALTDYYRVANSLDELNNQRFTHIGWVTSASPGDPKSVPPKPTASFKILAPGDSGSFDLALRVTTIGGLKSGPGHIQFIAENLPAYSDAYMSKLTQAWSAYGRVWTTTFRSEPIPFVMPERLNEVHCP